MIKYKADEVVLTYETASIVAHGHVLRQIDDGDWEFIDTFATSLPQTNDSHEIVKAVALAVRGIARKDFVVNTIFEEAADLIVDQEYEFEQGPND